MPNWNEQIRELKDERNEARKLAAELIIANVSPLDVYEYLGLHPWLVPLIQDRVKEGE